MVTKEEVSFSLKEMMRNVEETVKTDKVYKFNMKGMGVFKVQWKIRGIKGYQIFEKDNYSYKFGEEVDDPDVTLFIREPIHYLMCTRFNIL